MATVKKTVRLPSGDVISVTVDDMWTDDEIKSRLEQKMGRAESSGVPFSREAYYKELNRQMRPIERFATAFDRGVTRLGQGLFSKEPDEVKAAAGDLTRNYASGMAGDIIGKTAPLAPLAVAGAGGAIMGKALPAATTRLGQIGTAMGTGAIEGGLVARSEGQKVGTGAAAGGGIAGAAELALPAIGRIAGKVYRAAFGSEPAGRLVDMAGRPTPALEAALRKSGMSFDDLTDEAVDFVARQSPDASSEQIARAARFRSQGIDATQGQVTQDFGQQAREARLAERIDNPVSDPLRTRLEGVNNQFVDAVEGLAGELGSSRAAGDSVKSAIGTAKDAARKTKNTLYQQAADEARKVGGVPLEVSDIASAIPSDMRRRARLLPSGQVKAFDDLLVEFGIDQSPEAVEAFTKNGDRIIPLSVENAEEFRQALKNFSTGTGDEAIRWQAITGGVLDAFDSTLDSMAENTGGKVGQILKAARAANRQYRTEFSPQSLAGRLIQKARDGETPIVEASRVMREFRTKPVEQLQKTLSVLGKAGDDGRVAVSNMRASVVLDALEEAMKAPSNKSSGRQMANTTQFSKYLDQKFGQDRLKVLFKGQDDALRKLNGLMQTGLDLQPPAKAMPKGSAAVNADLIAPLRNKIGPVLFAMLTPVRVMAEAGIDNAAVRTAMNPKVQSEAAQAIASSYPRIASLLGMPSVAALNEQDEEQ